MKMKKFKIGDRVEWIINYEKVSGTVLEIKHDGRIRVNEWDHPTCPYMYTSDELVFAEGYEDFQDKIKDRL